MSTPETAKTAEARGQFISVGSKLAGTTVAVVAVVAICVFVALRRYEERNLLASKEAAATMVARLYVATAVAPLTFADDKGVQEVVGLLAANGDIVHASAWSIVQGGGEGASLGERLGELRHGDTVPPPAHIPRALEVHRTESNVIVEAPVMDPTNKLVGVVQAAFSLAPEHEALAATERRTLATSMGTAALLSAILLLLARRVIVRPIARLALAAQALERGDAPQIRRTANDEIGALATAFVSMSEAIKQRERRIAERNADLRAVLDNVEEGFLGVTPKGSISAERSRIVDEWFGPPSEGATFFDYMEGVAGTRFGEWLRLGWEFATDGVMPVDVAVAQLPQRFERGSRSYAVKYRPVLAGEDITAMIVVIQDVTERVARERAEEAQREMMVVFTHVIEGRTAFEEFFADTERLLASIEQKASATDPGDEADLFRDLHTLKGNAATFALETIARRCHDLEGRMAEEKQRPTPAELALLRAEWDCIATTYRKFSGSKTTTVTLDEQDQEELLRKVGEGADVKTIAALVRSWRDERASVRMQAIGDQVTRLAARLGKGDVKVEIAPSTLRLPARRWGPFWSVFGHVVRNAVDHGLEGAEKRRASGKPEVSHVRMSLETEAGGGVVFRFGDDGAGIDWERVAEKAKERGLPAATREDLTKALFVDSLSTRDAASVTSGRGVGLAAVLACVAREGGSIEVLSERGEGTTFVFHFPPVGV